MLVFTTILGFVLRLIYANQSFWLDEGASIMIARFPLENLIEAIKPDFHPPLFYAILHFWLPLAGKSEWLIRLPFILLATAAIPATYILCQEIFGKKSIISGYAALFLALNPLHIYYSQELRMYSLVTLCVVISWIYLFRKNYFLTAVFNLLSLFTFYGAVFNIASQVVYLFSKKSKSSDYLQLLLPPVLAFVSWWPVLSIQLQNGGYLKKALPGWQILSGTLTLKSLFLIPLKFILGRISLAPDRAYFLIGGLLIFLFSAIAVRVIAIKKSLPLWVAFVVPLLVASLFSLKTPVLGYWRFVFLIPFFTSLLAAGVYLLPRVIRTATIIWVCGIFLFFNLYFWTNNHFHREDWRGLSNLVTGKNALLIIPFPDVFAPLNFYSPDVGYILAQDRLGHNREDLKEILTAKAKTHSSFFVMEYLSDLTDPEREILKTIRETSLKEDQVYNLNNLGQVRLFQKYENSH